MNITEAQCPPILCKPYASQPLVLPEELVAEILSRLCVKALMRFNCVCKSWESLISNPHLAKLHLKRSKRNPHILLVWDHIHDNHRDNDFSVVPISIRRLLENPPLTLNDQVHHRLRPKRSHWVVGSCNGLLCLVGYTMEFEEYRFCLWNPATRVTSQNLAHFSIPCDLKHCYFRFSFGYDNLTETYKLVSFHLDHIFTQEIEVKICSIGENSWRNLQSFPAVPIYAENPWLKGVYLNGTLSWLMVRDAASIYCYNLLAITVDQLMIISLDMGKETYTQLLLPRDFNELPHAEPNIGVLMECLCFSHDSKGTHLVIWLMKDFGVEESWSQFLKVRYSDLQIHSIQFYSPLLLLCSSENVDVLIMTKIDENQAILYNWRDNRAKRTKITDSIRWDLAEGYVESLVSPC